MDTDVLELLAAPFVASLVLSGIHTYLGIHVVERGVIFVDLALAQVAALGTTFGFLMGASLHDGGAHWWSLGFTFVGAAIFTLTRTRRTSIPQEALIGIVYAVSAALSIAVVSQAPEGAEHIKDMLVGSILVVSWEDIRDIAILYGIVGLFHWIFRKSFLLLSFDPARAYAEGMSVRRWDFLFYISFGLVVTYAVAIAGVLLVFTYLIVPSVFAMMFSNRVGPRLILGWGMSTFVSAAGVLLSFLLDLPTGATIICTFGLTLLLASFVYLAIRRGYDEPLPERRRQV